MQHWVLASSNSGKLLELSRATADWGVEWESSGALGLAAPEEIHGTFLENALLKARVASQASGRPALADDSGLLVDALCDLVEVAARLRCKPLARPLRKHGCDLGNPLVHQTEISQHGISGLFGVFRHLRRSNFVDG